LVRDWGPSGLLEIYIAFAVVRESMFTEYGRVE
jgi:hypothetical protein